MSKSQALLYSLSKIPAAKLAKIFVALSVDARIRIMRNIAKRGTFGAWKDKQGRGCTIKEAGLGLKIGWPTLSHHVSVLEKAGLITVTRHGRHKRCWITTEAIQHIGRFLFSMSPRRYPYPSEEQIKKYQQEA
jgi:DNA-binding transcriptional ArsR family regulator